MVSMSRKIASHYVLGLCGLMLFCSSPDAQALPKMPFFGKKKADPEPPKMPAHLDGEDEVEREGEEKPSKPEPTRSRGAAQSEETSESESSETPAKKDMSEDSEEFRTEEEHSEGEIRSRKLPGVKTDRSVLEDNRELELPEQKKADSSVDPRRHYLIAKDLLHQKQYKACLTEVNKALALNPHYWDAMYVGCLSLQMQERNEEAIRKYRRLVKFKPDMTEAHVNLGILLKKTGQLDEAETEYRKAIDINFYKVDPHYNLANLLIEKGDLEGALGELKACLKLSPRNAWVHNNLGVIYQKRNYLEEAEEQFKKAIRLEPANRTFEQNLKSVQAQMKKKDVGA